MKTCPNCNSIVNDNEKFCGNCGAEIPQVGTPVQQMNYAYSAPAAPVGFSDRVNDPEILAAVKKNKKAAAIFGFIIVPIPFIGFTIYSNISDSMEPKQGMLVGLAVSVIFLLFALFSAVKNRASNTYEGVVTKKKSRLRYRNNGSDSSRDETYTEYITYVKTSDGKTKKIREVSTGRVLAYNYLPEGARFKYHPQFNFPYELYDKSQAPYIACVSCGTENPVSNDRCSKCNIPLLK